MFAPNMFFQRTWRSLLGVLGLWVVSACQSPQSPPVAHVLVIGIDGLSPDGIRQAETPQLDALMARGASTLQARAVLPTSSSPNWASMLMGAGPEQHGITSNSWELNDHRLAPQTHGPGRRFPTIFTLLRQQRPEAETGAIYHWAGFGRLFDSTEVSYQAQGESEQATAQLAADYLQAKRPTFLFVHLDHVDGAGHRHGHGTAAYYAAVSRADSLVGHLLAALEAADLSESTLVLLTADHGGRGYGHGGETLAEIEIPFVLAGAGIKPGHNIRHAVSTVDQAPTVAFALGLTPPYAWTGRPVRSAFVGQPVPAGSDLRPILPQPEIVAKAPRVDNLPPSAPQILRPEVTLTLDASETRIHYTLDGSEPTEQSPRYRGSFSLEKSATLRARGFRAGYAPSLISRAELRVIRRGPANGLRYAIYPGESWERLPAFDQMTPQDSGIVFEPDLALLPAVDQAVGVRFVGTFDAEQSGTYRFFLQSDDGSRLYLDGQLVVDNDGQHGSQERSGKIELSRGRHVLRLDYFNALGDKDLLLRYAVDDGPKQVLSGERLFFRAP